MTQQADSILIRPCQGRDEFEACVQLQIDTWGYDPADLVPNRSFMLAQKIALETNECAALAVANQFSIIRPAIRERPRRPF